MRNARALLEARTDTTATEDLLRRVPFLRGIDAPALERIAVRLAERRFRKGARLFAEGEPCPGFWIVREGSVNVYKLSEHGRVQILETCFPGGIVALPAALDGGGYLENAEAREDSTLIYFPREELFEAMRAAPETAVAVAIACAARLRQLTSQVASVALCGVRTRVAAHLVEEIEARGRSRPDGTVEVALGARQQEVARRIGTVREVLARTLKALAEQGLIERKRDLVHVLNLPALRRLAQK